MRCALVTGVQTCALPICGTSVGMLRLLDGVGFESAVCAIAPEGAITNEEPQASASITFPNFLLKPFEAYFIGFIVANFSNISGLCHGLAEPRLSGGSPWRMRHIASGKIGSASCRERVCQYG